MTRQAAISERVDERATMLKEELVGLAVEEAMEVCGGWQRATDASMSTVLQAEEAGLVMTADRATPATRHTA